ncbi:hypothetical protein B4U79_17413 [Dinothrombium tinctorium]|uniref:Uncharacterized protein n=1 Tax=Dinothrombium tinctorium TaxID=1965070 RepID=A0A3S4R822_9ACAR|nr:hypothetical protein B4U79_17415 [Dinothrombium tinctorium]RWS12824.1 hypothetical protein B4U79_17413 [Dinothrombium tinctorium]
MLYVKRGKKVIGFTSNPPEDEKPLLATSANSEQIIAKHVWLKEQEDWKVFSAIRIAGKGKNGSLLAHYRKTKDAFNENSTEITYEYELYDIQSLFPIFRGTNRGLLVSGFGIGIDQISKNSIGMYFTSDGRACHFSKDNYEIDLKKFAIETEADEYGLTPPCWQSSVFLGCPHSFCYQASVDDIFFVSAKSRNSMKMVLFREAYYYTVPVGNGLPVAAPKISEVKYVSGNNDLKYDKLMENIDAAFNWIENNTVMTVMIKSDTIKYYENDVLTLTMADKVEKVFESWPLEARIRTGVYDSKAQLLYLFGGENYSTYKRNMLRGANMWQVVDHQKKIFDFFLGMPPELEGSFALDGKMFFLKDSYYYTKNEGESPESKDYTPESSYAYSKTSDTGIFHLENCPERSKELNLPRRYNRFKPSKYVPPKFSTQEKREWNAIFVTSLATTIVVICCLLVAAFCFLNKSQRKKAKAREIRAKTMKKSKTRDNYK